MSGRGANASGVGEGEGGIGEGVTFGIGVLETAGVTEDSSNAVAGVEFEISGEGDESEVVEMPTGLQAERQKQAVTRENNHFELFMNVPFSQNYGQLLSG